MWTTKSISFHMQPFHHHHHRPHQTNAQYSEAMTKKAKWTEEKYTFSVLKKWSEISRNNTSFYHLNCLTCYIIVRNPLTHCLTCYIIVRNLLTLVRYRDLFSDMEWIKWNRRVSGKRKLNFVTDVLGKYFFVFSSIGLLFIMTSQCFEIDLDWRVTLTQNKQYLYTGLVSSQGVKGNAWQL
jgi:hypothetical protein